MANAFAMIDSFKEQKKANDDVKKLRTAVNNAQKESLMVIGNNSDWGNHKMQDQDKFTFEFVDANINTGFLEVSTFGMPMVNNRYLQPQIFKTLEEAEQYAEDFSRPKPSSQVAFLVYVHKFEPGPKEREFRASIAGKVNKSGNPYKTIEEVIESKQGQLAILKTGAFNGTMITNARDTYDGLEGNVFIWRREGATKDDTKYGLNLLPDKVLAKQGITALSEMPKKDRKELQAQIDAVDIEAELFPEGFEELRNSVIAKESKNFAKAIDSRKATETSAAKVWGA